MVIFPDGFALFDALTRASARLLLAAALPAAGALTATLVAIVFPASAATTAVAGLIVVRHIRLLYCQHRQINTNEGSWFRPRRANRQMEAT
jgi:hypothetical protein